MATEQTEATVKTRKPRKQRDPNAEKTTRNTGEVRLAVPTEDGFQLIAGGPFKDAKEAQDFARSLGAGGTYQVVRLQGLFRTAPVEVKSSVRIIPA